MTNRDKYKQAFSAIHISEEFIVEVGKMEHKKTKKKINYVAAAIAGCILLISGSTVAYAADFGGIQRTIQLWIHGDQTEVTIDFNGDGSYNMNYLDEAGESVQQGGGGVAFNEDGSERPLTEEELLDHLNAADVRYEDDGTVWIYYYDQKVDITDKFKDGVCYVHLIHGTESLYMTIKYGNGWASSPNKYIEASSFQ